MLSRALLGRGRRRQITVGATVAISASLVWSQFPELSDSYTSGRDILVRSMGFGALPPVVWLVALVAAAKKRPSLLRRGLLTRWLAALLASTVVWGVLAYFSDSSGILRENSLGGWIGKSIKGPSDALGVFRVAGIAALVGAVAFPRRAARLSRTLLLLAFGATKGAARLRGRPSFRGLGRFRQTRETSRSEAQITVQRAPPPEAVGRAIGAPKPVDRPAPIPPKGVQAPPPPSRPINPQPARAVIPPLEPETPVVLPSVGQWPLPSLSLLKADPKPDHEPGIDQEATARLIEDTLSEYGIEVKVAEVKLGPVVTMFGLSPGWVRRSRLVKESNQAGEPVLDSSGKQVVRKVEDKTRVKVDSIVAREKDLALALAAPSLRIEAPIPGVSLVGIEVPNPNPSVVTLRSVMESDAFKALQAKSKLALALGLGTGNEVAVADLARMPHLLIAGATGSGKSVCINAVIACVIMQSEPWETRLLLIDPKRVELTPYNGIPHLLTPVIVEVEVASQALRGMIQEMLRRYKRMEEAGVRNIEGFNRGRPPEERMPLLMVAIDELADLMMAAPSVIEQSIIRLAQLGRATGIHLVVATQRPSVDVVTGLIKANFPSRISFAVASQVDSRTILDSVGAEKLLGRGDMLFQPPDTPKPKRSQGVFITDKEVEDLVDYWRRQKGPPPPHISLDPPEEVRKDVQRDGGDMGDELLEQAWELATQYNRLSTSLLQRRLRIGYPRAARLMDMLEEEGVIGPGEAGKSRDVLINKGQENGR